MFKFGFLGDQGSGSGEEVGAAAEGYGAAPPAAEEVPEEEGAGGLTAQEQVELCAANGVTLIKGSVVAAKTAELLGPACAADSDIIPGVYEGGFKLWEGGMDLAVFMAAEASLGGAGALSGQQVLELGCGHGLPGIVALLAGAAVHFQDYNKEVLRALTIPSVLANWAAHCRRRAAVSPPPTPPARYFSGDWRSLYDLLKPLGLQGSYDAVLSAETIYSLAAIASLHACIKQCLKRPSGVAYIAAKSFYFGVGGGVAAFLELVREDGAMRGEVVHIINDGQSNKREIIKLCWQ